MAQTHYRAFTIDHTKVNSGTQTNFPVVISGTYSWAATIANGGRAVNGNSGFDIRAYSDTGLTSAYTYQLRSYNATTGAFNMVVLIPSLSAAVDTVIYIGLGDAALNTDGSSTGVWDSNFKAVYAMGDGTTLSLADSTTNANTLTNINVVTATSGVAGGMGAASFNGTTQSLDRLSAPVTAEPLTLEALYNPNDGTTTAGVVALCNSTSATNGLREMAKRASSTIRTQQQGATGANDDAAINSYTASAWNYAASTFASLSSRDIHPNGAAKTSLGTVIASANASDRLSIGALLMNGSHSSFYPGKIGEVRISNVVRADSWIVTTYNNLVGIASFYSVGGEVVFGATLAFTQQPSTVASGAANSPSITVQLSDSAAGVTVTMAKLTGTGTLSGTLTAVSNGSGLATFSNIIITGAGPHTLQATASGHSSANSSSFTVTHTALTAWAAFIAANGGDSAWIAAADYRVNVTDDGTGKASQWDDVRGAIAGAMLPLTQATQAKRYTIGGSGLVGTALAQSHMLSALDSRIMLDQVAGPHAFLIAQSPSGSSYLFGISQDPTDTTSQPYLYLITNGSTFGMQGNSGGGGTTNQFVVDQGTTFDATVRPIIVGRQTYIGGAAGDYTYEVRIPGKQGSNRQILPIASATASGMKVAIGRWGTTYADLTIMGFGITTQALTKTLVANFETFATTQFSASPDLAKRGTLVADGVSTNRAHNSTHPVAKGGDVAANTGITADFYLCERAVTGFGTFASIGYEDDVARVMQAANSRYFVDQSALIAPRYAIDLDTRRGGGHLYFLGFQGSALITSPYSLAGGDVTFETALTAVVASLVAAGYSVIGETMNELPQWYTTGTLNQSGTNALLVNTWMRSTFLTLTGVVGLFDIEGSTGNHYMINRVIRGGGATLAYTDASWIDGTGHPTDAGQVLRGQVMRTFFEGSPTLLIPATTGTSYDSSYGQRLQRRRRRQ